jgi:O-antigen ligase
MNINNYLTKILILLIAILPLASVPGVFKDFFIEPYRLKILIGLIGLIIIYSFYVLNLYLCKKKIIELKTSRAYFPIFGFILWSFATILWVDDYVIASEMLLQYCLFGFLFVLSVNLINNVKSISALFNALTSSLVIVSILGLLQYYFINNVFVQDIILQATAPAATFGSKNMASHFVVMTLPLVVAMLLSAKNNIRITVYAIAIGVASWFLIYTMARQAYVAIAVELLLLFIFLALDKWKNKDKGLVQNLNNKKSKSVAILSILIFLAFAANLTNQGFNVENNVNLKIDKIKSIKIDENNPRLPAWINTIEMIKDHPISGVGVGQWAVMYPIYHDQVEKDIVFNERTRIKMLHNDFLETFANFGLIGFSFLMWLAYSVLTRIWRILSDQDNEYRIYVLGVTLSLIGFLVVAFFSFPARVFLPGFLVFTLLGILWIENKERVYINISKRISFVLIFGLIVGLFSVNYYIKYVASKNYIEISQRNFKVNDSERFLYLLKSIDLMPNSYLSNRLAGQFLLRDNKFKESIPYLYKSHLIRPYDSVISLLLAAAYGFSGLFDKEREILEGILKYDSKNVRAWHMLTRHYRNLGSKDKALEAYEKMKNSFELLKNRQGFGPYYSLIIPMSMSFSDYKYTGQYYRELLRIHPSAVNYAANGKVEYYFLNNKEKSRESFNKALELDSNVIIPQEIRDDLKL